MYEKEYENIVEAIVEYGYIVVENILDNKSLELLVSEALNEKLYKNAGISTLSKVDSTRRKDKIRWLEGEQKGEKLFLEFTEGLREYINRSLYLGLSYYEAHFALYEEGDFYEKHLDAFRGSKNRVVTTVYYLNDAWSEKDGGELLIYDEDNKLIESIKPSANTLVVFLSDKFPHEVLPAKKKRHSIAGWFRVDKREY